MSFVEVLRDVRHLDFFISTMMHFAKTDKTVIKENNHCLDEFY